MSKVFAIAKVNLAQYLAYRLSFVLWRVRVILSLLLTFFLWSAVYEARLSIFNYTHSQILTYILLIYIIGDLVYSSRTADLAAKIRNGEIINYLLKPFPFLSTMFIREAVDKVLNICFSLLEISVFILLVKPDLYLQTDPAAIALMLVALGSGIVISFFVSFAISLIAFWSSEVWAPRFVFFVLITALSGSYFPLDILPKVFYQILLLTPFPYFAYLPTKIFLDGFSFSYLALTGVSLVWVILTYLLAKGLWRKGIREFSFFGR